LERKRQVDARRPIEVRGRYSSPEWRKARREYLATHPTCPCGKPAEAVDHVRPWRSQPDPERAFWDRTNWAPTCWRCHSSKTTRHDGGFGNTRRT
jgi:5-methylcytosine-specific restriction protein A